MRFFLNISEDDLRTFIFETFLRSAGCWSLGRMDWFSVLCRLFCSMFLKSPEHSDRLKEPLEETLISTEKMFSWMLWIWFRSPKIVLAALWLSFTWTSISNLLRTGEKGLSSFLMNALKSMNSFSIDRGIIPSIWQGLIGHGSGLTGGLLLEKNEESSDWLKPSLLNKG